MAPPPPAVRGLLSAACYPRCWRVALARSRWRFPREGGNQHRDRIIGRNRPSEALSLYIHSVNGQPLQYTPRKPNMRNETCEA